jgi:hypothetical protein
VANVILCMVASVVLIVTPLRKNDQPKTANDARSSNGSQPNPDIAKPSLNAKNSDSPNNNTATGNQQTTPDSNDYRFWGMVINIVLGIATALIAIFSIVQGVATKRSADAAVASERAWVIVSLEKPVAFITDLTVKGVHKSAVRVMCNYVNQGKTPASVRSIKAALVVLEAIDSLESLSEEPDISLLTTEIFLVKTLATGELGQQWLDLTAEKSREFGKLMVVYGVIEYRHLFSKKKVTTTFGYCVTPGENLVRFTNHPKYNENT